MPARTCVHARARAAGPGSGSGSGSYPAWFFLNQVSRVWTTLDPNQTRSDPPRQQTRSAVRIRTDPPTGVRLVGRPRVASLLDCQRLRTYWTANGCEPVGLPKVANQLDGQRVQWLGRKVAAFHLGSNLLAPPGRLYKGLQILN